MSAIVVGPEVLIDPATVRRSDTTNPEWLQVVRGFVEAAAERGNQVRVMVEEESFSPEAAARQLHVSRSTVRRAILSGEIKAFKRGTHYRLPASEVRRFNKTLAHEVAEFFADDEF